MKVVHQIAYTDPEHAVACVEVPDPALPVGDMVLIEILAFPINPADVLTLTGNYAAKPPLPALLGAEGLGRVLAVGEKVADLAEGDLVIPLDRENWVQRKLVSRANVVKVSDGDPQQLAMLKVNPATAHLMLRDYVDFAPGDGVIQNAANSGVGLAVDRLGRSRGLTVVNVVRRPELVDQLKADGAEIVLLDGDDLAERVAEATGAPIRLAIDAVAGEGTLRLSRCLADGGVIANYGMLSGVPCQVHPNDVVFRNITLRGFWLSAYLLRADVAEKAAIYGDLSARVASGALKTSVEKVYPIEEIAAAAKHAATWGRSGKILVTPNG